MTATAQQISEANLHERLAMSGPRDELRQFADTIDGLLERLGAAFDAHNHRGGSVQLQRDETRTYADIHRRFGRRVVARSPSWSVPIHVRSWQKTLDRPKKRRDLALVLDSLPAAYASQSPKACASRGTCS